MTKKHTDYAAAVVALIDNGCDCGAFPEEKGTCLACVCDRALREVETERDEAIAMLDRLEWSGPEKKYWYRDALGDRHSEMRKVCVECGHKPHILDCPLDLILTKARGGGKT